MHSLTLNNATSFGKILILKCSVKCLGFFFFFKSFPTYPDLVWLNSRHPHLGPQTETQTPAILLNRCTLNT